MTIPTLVRCRNPWTIDTIRRLRELAAIGSTVTDIASALGRSESAIRNKAGLHGIPLISARPAKQINKEHVRANPI